MRLVESRRVTGPHLLLDRPGAAAEIELEPGDDVVGLCERAGEVVRALGWTWAPVVRAWPGGVSIAFEAPEDQLETASYVFDHLIDGAPSLDELRTGGEVERKPQLVAFLAAVRARGLPVFWEDGGVTVGLGANGQTWPLDALPDPATVGGGRIPFALITGTNGKTTSTRLLARMAREAGYITGNTSSDGVVVGDDTVQRGDWTGPGATRQVMRDQRVGFAVLETARGGLMRRGLAVVGADAALVTNVSDDHLGEWGITDLASTAQMKLVVAKGLRPGGVLVVNQACAPLAEAAAPLHPVWFGVEPGPDRAAYVEDGWIVVDGWPLVALANVPITLGGAARFNVENVLGASLVACRVGLDRGAIVRALRGFLPTPHDNAGRMNVFDWHGAKVIVDFAHNPDGVRQLGVVLRALPAQRRLVLLGQAGDRRTEDVASLVREVCAVGFDRYQLKELPEHRRGKLLGEVPAALRALLVEYGVPAEQIADPPDDGELAAVHSALAWSQPGDLLLLLVHEQFEDVVALLSGAA